jgi:hypothetical protein
MALTLLESMKLDPSRIITNAVIQQFAMQSPILERLQFQDISGNALSFNREKTLPDVGFRGINEGFVESTGVLEPQVEALKIFGGDLDTDTFLDNTTQADVRATHEMMKVKSMSHAFDRIFIKGDSSKDPRVFDGLQVRLDGTQVINAGSTSGGDALSLAALDELIDAVEMPTALLVNKPMRRLLTVGSRNTAVGGQIDFTVDAFGRQIQTYAGLPILALDYDNLGQQILPFTEENPGGGTPASTSIYCVSMGPGMLMGLQGEIGGRAGINVRDVGESHDKPVLRTRVEWYVAIALMNARSAARLRGIKNAPVVA